MTGPARRGGNFGFKTIFRWGDGVYRGISIIVQSRGKVMEYS